MAMVPRLTLHGLLPQGFPLHSLPVKLRTGSGDVEYQSSSKNSRANHGFSLGGPWMPKRVAHGMTALNGMIMGGCLTEITRGNETRNYVTELLLGSMNQHLSFAFPRLRPLRLHTGIVVIMISLTCPNQPRARLTTYWRGAQTCRPGSMDRVPYCRAREGGGDCQTDTLVDRFTQIEIGS